MEILRGWMGKMNARFADGRAHVAGDKITAADFALLATFTSIFENQGCIHDALK